MKQTSVTDTVCQPIDAQLVERWLSMLYRIFTEDKNQATIESILNKYFEGYTLYKADGFWRLQREQSLIIEIITEDIDRTITELANEIKTANGQEAVLIQKIKNHQWLV